MKILVNHVGYELESRTRPAVCRAVLQSTNGEVLPDEVILRDSEGRYLGQYAANSLQSVEGWKNRTFRLVRFKAPEGGPYILEAAIGDTRAVSASFHVGLDIEAASTLSDILFGFTVGRSAGISDRKDREIPFFGKREETADVHGGWYDASGDTSKYLSHLSYANYMNPQQTPLVVWCLLDAYEHLKESRFRMEERLTLRFQEEAVWGADFLKRMQDPDGYFYTTVFDIWSKDPDERRICSFRTQRGILTDDYQAGYRQGGGMVIAALARAANVLKESETATGDFGPDDYLEAALSGWRHLEQHNLEYLDDGKENIIDDTCALLAAVELLAAGAETGGSREIRIAAELRTRNLIERWSSADRCFRADDEGERSWFHASDEALPLIALMRAVETGAVKKPLAEEARNIVNLALKTETERAMEVSNPFFHPRRLVRIPGRKDKDQFFYPHQNPSGYWWQGENARLASWSAAFRRNLKSCPAHGMTVETDAVFATAQVSWILGLNPFDACMLQGHGINNPSYDWDQFNVSGGVANGITSGFEDEDDIAFMPPEAAANTDHTWRWSEQWIPHAAWLLLAVAWSVPARSVPAGE